MAAEQPKPTIFDTAADFRAWLETNHDSGRELWVGYYKKGSDKTSMSYAEAVEEALCFGWIDGLTRSFGEFYANRFTPRRIGSSWSAINIAKMAELERAGRLHPAGRRAFEERDRRRDAPYSYERAGVTLPAAMERRLREHADAWRHWQAETPSYRRSATAWVVGAKRQTTRERRLSDLIADSAAGRRVKPFRYFEKSPR